MARADHTSIGRTWLDASKRAHAEHKLKPGDPEPAAAAPVTESDASVTDAPATATAAAPEITKTESAPPASARDAIAISTIAKDLARPSFCDLMGIDPTPRVVDEREVLTLEPEVPPDEPTANASAAPQPALVTQVYADQAHALRQRLNRQRAAHGLLIEAVAQGKADASEIARSRGRMRETQDQLEDLAALQAHQDREAVAREARNAVLRYRNTVHDTGATLTEALEVARAIDEQIDGLGVTLDRLRTLLASCDHLTAAAVRIGGHSLRDRLSIWTSQRTNLEVELFRRLRAVCGVTEETLARSRTEIVDAATAKRRVAEWARSWITALVSDARTYGPAHPNDNPEGDDAA